VTVIENIYLSGDFAPVHHEVTAHDLPVIGSIPPELEGRYLRNGPNPLGDLTPETHHWFSGHGMVHGVRLRGGRAEWYRNRWVRGGESSDLLGEPPLPSPSRPVAFGANTSVRGHAGVTLALVEGGTLPVELDYELNSVAASDFGGTLPNGFTAHPKIDPNTGEMHALCYSWRELADHVQYVVVATDGRVRRVVDIPLPGMTMLHDMSITQRYAVVYDLPVTIDPAVAGRSRFPFRWNPGHGARVGLLPREGTASEIVWCEVGPCYVYHALNAYDADDGTVVVDVCRYQRMFDRDVLGPAGDVLPTLDRWVLDPVRRTVSETRIDDRPQEFPRVRADREGLPHRFGYAAGVGAGFTPGATFKHDLVAGTTAAHDHGPGRGSAEPVFVARPGAAAEDDGWLLSYVHDSTRGASELVVLDARDLSEPPVARVPLPQRVPFGFHGDFVPDTDVPPGR
jgi:8'-apo-carotenoid 13,14-cleaving dioxygenase